MHDGAFVTLEAALFHHLDAICGAPTFSTAALPVDLRGPTGPRAPALERLDPSLRAPVQLSDDEFSALPAFLRDGLLDPAARPERLKRLIRERLPSGRAPLQFQFP